MPIFDNFVIILLFSNGSIQQCYNVVNTNQLKEMSYFQIGMLL